MIQIGDETLNDAGTATFNGTNLDEIIFNRTTVYRKMYAGVVASDIHYENVRLSDDKTKILFDITQVGFYTSAEKRDFDRTVNFKINAGFKGQIDEQIQSPSPTFKHYFADRDDNIKTYDLGIVTIPAGTGVYNAIWPTFIQGSIDVTRTSTSSSSQLSYVDNDVPVVTLTRDGRVTTVLNNWVYEMVFKY
jgi:hypothetical protein